jgi:hypothetical protein
LAEEGRKCLGIDQFEAASQAVEGAPKPSWGLALQDGAPLAAKLVLQV